MCQFFRRFPRKKSPSLAKGGTAERGGVVFVHTHHRRRRCNYPGGCYAAYGPSNCAERTAVFKAVSEGCREFEAIAIAGGLEDEAGQPQIKDFCPPCGVCRQVLAEFCEKDFKILLTDGQGTIKEFTLGELLPESFSL